MKPHDFALYVASSSHNDGSSSVADGPATSAAPGPFLSSKRALKSKSTPSLPIMAMTVENSRDMFRSDLPDLNTLPDPRTPSPHSVGSHSPSMGPQQHPDLSEEIATLSTKLINAINHQTHLDDALQSTREELRVARKRIAELEEAAKAHEDMMQHDMLISRVETDKVEEQLRGEIEVERLQKNAAEKQKKAMEQELENLTSTLFEEANSMVATARKEHDDAEKTNEILRTKLNDTEALLVSHQQQLQDLKVMLQDLQAEREHNEDRGSSNAPSTPVMGTHEKVNRLFDTLSHSRNTSATQAFFPEHPLHYAHLISPVLRTDTQAFDEFSFLHKTAGKLPTATSRTNSGNFAGLNVMGIGNHAQSHVMPSQQQSPGNQNNAPVASSSPGLNHSTANASNSPSEFGGSPHGVTPSLKETKFYKRSLAEDIEPTLRLDLAPGLSWLARRSVISAMSTGNLIVEPSPPGSRFYSGVYTCSLCGEHRGNEPYIRRHRFRTSESDEAQRYYLCDFCLGRMRVTGDFVTFLRMVRQGHWSREDTDGGCKAAWEECVRLRERMFWSRVGGGVVPAGASPSAVEGTAPTSGSPTKSRTSKSDRMSSPAAFHDFAAMRRERRGHSAGPSLDADAPVVVEEQHVEVDADNRIQAETADELRINVRASMEQKAKSPLREEYDVLETAVVSNVHEVQDEEKKEDQDVSGS